ncbi:hypothetical protein [Paenibacillus sp. 1182]|uniref:hypothetical protein n=1 Tax=unclassified Paenibacillus TaxID=185978 RepID=UPI000FA26FE4|nr:hypothetical protein [Paenibacillus sp. 1182]MBP1311899.1 hypothetical protein [Paenibacillus sp. 1182]
MKKNPRLIGDEHVKDVYQALLKYIKNESIDYYPKTVTQTVLYITNLYPYIESVKYKFDTNNPDQEKDLTLYVNSNQTISVNLFLVRKGGRIQQKNPGAKSFFSKYFLSERLQLKFNQLFEMKYQNFLNELVELKLGEHYVKDIKELKKLVSGYFPKFTDEINPYRDLFLYNLRELCFSLLKDFYNERNEGFFHAYNVFFMTEDVNIITSYGKTQNDVNVEQFDPGTPRFSDIQIYKSGKNAVGIKYGEVALTLRFKFESSPTSSIKLAASYDKFPDESEKEEINFVTVKEMQYLLNNHQYTHNSNSSNAIGKCHEAITYFYFLKEFPNVSQVEPDECVQLMRKYYSLVKPQVLEKLYNSTSSLVPVIREKLSQKYNNFQIKSVELVPESYINDRLDTGDLQLILIVNKEYIVESISLKALAKRNSNITTKNPGIGTIIGPTYFNIGTLEPVVNEVKSKFQIGELNHKESLEVLAAELGLKLKEATQEQLKRGIENLLGKAMLAVTFYDDNVSICKEHSKIDGNITVYIKTPTAIQNKLAWHNDLEAINLRVKFSRGQNHGWSTVKLTSEYRLK